MVAAAGEERRRSNPPIGVLLIGNNGRQNSPLGRLERGLWGRVQGIAIERSRAGRVRDNREAAEEREPPVSGGRCPSKNARAARHQAALKPMPTLVANGVLVHELLTLTTMRLWGRAAVAARDEGARSIFLKVCVW